MDGITCLKLYCQPLGTQLLNVITLIHNTDTIRTQLQILFNNVPLHDLTYKGTSCGAFLSTNLLHMKAWACMDVCPYVLFHVAFNTDVVTVLHLEHGFVWCWNVDASGSRSEIPGRFRNVVLEKDEEDQLYRSCEKWRSVNEQRNILHEIRKRKANWIGHILRRNCLLHNVIEGKIKGGIAVTGRRGRRRRKLLDDLKDRRGYSHLKEEALDRTMWRAGFGTGFGPVVRQTAKWMYEPIQQSS